LAEKKLFKWEHTSEWKSKAIKEVTAMKIPLGLGRLLEIKNTKIRK